MIHNTPKQSSEIQNDLEQPTHSDPTKIHKETQEPTKIVKNLQ